jgi:K+-sensing histidine kinase KdpD
MARAAVLQGRRLRVVNRIDELLCVRANEAELQEVLAMALDNALRFGAPGSEIQINGEALKTEGEIRILDQGSGVSPGQLDNLFEPFFVMGSRHHEEGFGLSLAMARLMIEQAGGRIWAESAGQDGGFTLVIRLPLV